MENKNNEEQQRCSSPEEDVMDLLATMMPAIALTNFEAHENEPGRDTTPAYNNAGGGDVIKTLAYPPPAQFADVEDKTAPDKNLIRCISPSRKKNTGNVSAGAGAGETTRQSVEVVAGTGVDDVRVDPIINKQSTSSTQEAGSVGNDNEPAMEIDFSMPDPSVLCQTDFLMDSVLMDIVEEGLREVIDTTRAEPVKAAAEPWPEVRPPPTETPSPARSYEEFIAQPGPSWADDVYDLDYITWNRPPHGTPGRHNLGGDLSRASDLAVQTRHRSRYGSRTDFQRSSRHNPYDISTREHTRTTELRRSRLLRNPTRDNEYGAPFTSLTNPPPYPTHKHPAPETGQYQTIRQMLNPNYSPQNTSQLSTPRNTSQSTSQNPPMVQIPTNPPMVQFPSSSPLVQFPSSPPKTFTTSHDTHRPSTIPKDYFDIPYISAESYQPLDLSPLPRQPPPLIPISQTMSTRPVEVRTNVRSTPRTHTVTSTVNSSVYLPTTPTLQSTANAVELQPPTTRLELYSNCSEHLLSRKPTNHRARTPTDQLPEHLQYQTWPVDNLSSTDHTEEIDMFDCESWFESMHSDSSESAAIAPQSSIPTTNPPPIRNTEPMSLTSSATIASTSPPRSLTP